MKATLPIVLIVLLVVFVAAGTLHSSKLLPARSPQAAVQSLYDQVEHHNYSAAYSYVAPSSNVDQNAFYRDLTGKDGSLRTFSNLQSAQTKVLRENDNEALVRVNTEWSTAVGKFDDMRDLKVVKDQGDWKVVWPLEKLPNLPPQVIPVTYLRWDVIRRGNDDEWGAQNVEAPRVRIISMNALERDGGVIILGEIVNEDTVPAFVAVNATLLGKDGSTLGDESSFDKISHTLLPKEVSPFRIDFPGRKLSQVKSVRMQPTSLLVPASADPTIGVLHQRIETDARGHHVLQGELINESGETVNIPHVLATYYDNAGKVIWVSDGYVDHALLPQVPQPFAVALRDDLAPDVHTYRVTVNQYSIDRQD